MPTNKNPIPIRELNRYFWFEAGILLQAPMYQDGSMKKNESMPVTRPTIEDLSVINNRLGTRLTLKDFSSKRR